MNLRSDISPRVGWLRAIAIVLAAFTMLAMFAASARAHELSNAQDPNAAGDSEAHAKADAVDIRSGSRYLKMMKRVNRMNRARIKKRLKLGLPAQRVQVSDQGVRQRGFIQALGFDVSLTAVNLLDPTTDPSQATAPTANAASESGLSADAVGPTAQANEDQTGLWSPIIWPIYQVKPGDPDYNSSTNANPTPTGSGTTASPSGNSGDVPGNQGIATDPNPRIVPVFEALMPDGKVLYWDWLISGWFKDTSGTQSTRILLWDPAHPDQAGPRVDVPNANLFCAGFSHLPNGDLFLAGGNANSDFHGLKTTFIYHWRTKTFEQGPNMSRLRWYPSVAGLYNGEQLILGGDPPGGYGNPGTADGPNAFADRSVPEVYSARYSDPATQQFDSSGDQIRDLDNIRFGNDTSGPGLSDAVNPPSSRGYPFLVPSVDGRVLYAGYESGTYLVDTNGAGASQEFGPHEAFWHVNGSFVNYDTGKVLLVGGGTSAKYGDPGLDDETTCSDANLVGSAQCQALPGKGQEHGVSATPTYIDLLNKDWAQADQGTPGSGVNPYPHGSQNMPLPRRFDYSTVLPDGKVLVTGGMANTDPDNGDNAANDDFNNNLVNVADATKEALLWNPADESFTTLAPAAVAREYHSTAMLLPDGRVLTGGGGVCGPCTTQGNHYYNPNFEIFSPPYLFNTNGSLALRPSITSPTVNDGGASVLPPVGYDQPFDVTYTPGLKDGENADVSTAALLKLGTPTHSTDTGQRFVPLNFVKDTPNHVLHMTSPLNSYIAPPGYYMLFLVDDHGTPSVSKMVQIGADLSLHNITSVVNVYGGQGLTGTAQYLGLGEYTQTEGNFANVGDKQISSMTVAAGYDVTLCKSANGTSCATFPAGSYSTLGTYDNSVSYAKIETQETPTPPPDTSDPGTGTPPVTTPPLPTKPKLTAAKKMKLSTKLKFSATCPTGCGVTSTLNIKPKWYKLTGTKLKASATASSVTIKFSSKQYKTIKAALKKKKKVVVWFTIEDSSHQKAEVSAVIK